jgi:hypothetical protein
MTSRASRPFEVKFTPLALGDPSADASLGRMAIDKTYHGDLEATGKGEMLTAGSAATGSAGYVAIERITGKLKGREGSFVVQHSGIMNRGAPSLTVTVVPDSGTGQLAGLSGKFGVKIEQGKHLYEFEYSISDTPG